jgi:hypothetical protein
MFESKINRGRANGYAPLDGSGKVPLDKLPPIQSPINTGSFAKTGSNQFNGNQSISGSITTSEFIQTSNIQGTGSLYLQPDSTDNRHFEIYNTSPTDVHIKASSGISFFGDDTNYIKIDNTTDDVTIAAFSDIILTTDDGGVYIGSYGSDNGIVTNGYLNTIIGDTDIINTGTGNSITDVIGRIPTIDTGSFATTSSLQTIINVTGSFATTGSNTFIGNQIVSGTLNIATNNGDEGGEILLGKALTNTTIAGNNVIVDVFKDRVRIFEDSGSNRGAFLNIVSQSANVESQIVTSPNLFSIQTITSASYASLTPVSGTLYVIID